MKLLEVVPRAVLGRLARDFGGVSGLGGPLSPGPRFTQAGLLKRVVPEPALKSMFVWVCGIPCLSFFNILRCPRFRPSDQP